MKQYSKPFFITVFSIALIIFLLFFHKYEHTGILMHSIISPEKASALTEGKQLIATPYNLLYYQEQPLPFITELNTFLIPANPSQYTTHALSCMEGGNIYLIPKENDISENITESVSSSFDIYIIDNDSYFKTSVSFVPSAILMFQTESFESENAYGHMNFYMPDDAEIGMYSYKSSEAKLSYETANGLLPQQERNYTLKLTKKGTNNKLNLANLRKDDDWELDSLYQYPDQILRFYESWNDFCVNTEKEEFMIHYQIIDFYLDEQYMGKYLLRVPIDNKQLHQPEETFIALSATPADSDAPEMNILHDLLADITIDPSYHLEYYLWAEENDALNLHAIPRRFTKYTAPDSE